MSQVTRILECLGNDNEQASAELLPLVYDQLRALAAQKMAKEKPGHTLEATALVHEAYLRLVDVDSPQQWRGRGHFFAAAAEAMRRILIENARRKLCQKHGGSSQRVDLDEAAGIATQAPDKLLAIDEALSNLEQLDPQAGGLFKLRYFTGCSVEEAGELLGLSRASAYRHWTFARAWILKHVLAHE